MPLLAVPLILHTVFTVSGKSATPDPYPLAVFRLRLQMIGPPYVGVGITITAESVNVPDNAHPHPMLTRLNKAFDPINWVPSGSLVRR
jgi:hypothetical protein